MTQLAIQADSLSHGTDLAALVIAFHERTHGGSARWCDEDMCKTAWDCRELWELYATPAAPR